jgi:hypothetical protein
MREYKTSATWRGPGAELLYGRMCGDQSRSPGTVVGSIPGELDDVRESPDASGRPPVSIGKLVDMAPDPLACAGSLGTPSA